MCRPPTFYLSHNREKIWKTKCLQKLKKSEGKFVANGKSFTVVVFPFITEGTFFPVSTLYSQWFRKRKKSNGKKSQQKICSLNWSKRKIYCHNFCVHCIRHRTPANIIYFEQHFPFWENESPNEWFSQLFSPFYFCFSCFDFCL